MHLEILSNEKQNDVQKKPQVWLSHQSLIMFYQGTYNYTKGGEGIKIIGQINRAKLRSCLLGLCVVICTWS